MSPIELTWTTNKDPIKTQNAIKVLIKDQVLKIRTLLETVHYFFTLVQDLLGKI